ncbi:hypothetical protein SAY86_013266 [Trapa natans]|uniref:Uncharacterized protein n=1 Tax=Trapa natans TaxID=22666 RepID=A0AAN7R9Y6_TRANT|nr:hypothetical protein SAY86_013266 [Trapa natans]
MAKSLRSKKEKRLRAIRRELVEPLYDKKDAAKLAVLEAALAAPKLPVRPYPNSASSSMDVIADTADTDVAPTTNMSMDVVMADDSSPKNSLRPVGRIGKKLKKKFKMGKGKRRGVQDMGLPFTFQIIPFFEAFTCRRGTRSELNRKKICSSKQGFAEEREREEEDIEDGFMGFSGADGGAGSRVYPYRA